jgi:hypothetical protein
MIEVGKMMGTPNVRETRIATMNPRFLDTLPDVLPLPGERVGVRGTAIHAGQNLNRQGAIAPSDLRLMESFNVRGTCTVTMNRRGLLPLLDWGEEADVSLCPLGSWRASLRFRACNGTMNWFQKLRRSAMSIAANAPWSFPKLRRSGMFVRRFMESFNVRGTCIVTMNRVVFSLSSTGGEGWGE